MRIDGLFPRQGDDCVVCPDPEPCVCAPNEECVRINRDCSTCAELKCVKNTSTTVPNGVTKGALAGGVIGALVFLAIAVGLFFWYRRNVKKRKALEGAEVKDVPAPADLVLNRPDPIEKPAYQEGRALGLESVPEGNSTGTSPSLGPHYVFSASASNPFDDTNSIQTAGSEGTNVIPIALVPAGSHQPSLRSDNGTQLSGGSTGPVRPARSPDLNLDHVNVSNDNLRTGKPAYANSNISGLSSNNRHSYMSNMTSASEMLNEAPMIMTPTKGPVRVVKAEVISAGSLQPSSPNDSLKPPSAFSRPSHTSPLAATSFGPEDVVSEADESQEANPFDDKHSSTNANYSLSPPHTATTHASGGQQSRESHWASGPPNVPWAHGVGGSNDGMSRPSSMATQAGSVIDIASATRVNVGLATPTSAGSVNPYRTTMGRLISPSSTAATGGTLEEQQAWALAHAQATAQAQGRNKPRPVSGSSAISATADSILESFPFVPPSPISNRPIRSPPVSPLGQQSFSNGSVSPTPHQHKFVVAPPTPMTGKDFSSKDDDPLRAPPSRHTLGLSTASQFSTASSGLGSFPFQIDSGSGSLEAPPQYLGRQRASLDTLALTSDLSSYPLGFDRDAGLPKKKSD